MKTSGSVIFANRGSSTWYDSFELFLPILLFMVSIFASAPSAEASVQATYNQGTLTVGLPSTRQSGAWISINSPSATLTSYSEFHWQYVSSSSLSISVPSRIPPGTYQVRYFADGGYTLHATANFVIPQTNFSITSTYSAGTVAVSYSLTAQSGDWIAISLPGSPSTSYAAWTYAIPGASSASISFSTPGAYEVRYLRNNGYQIAATSTVQIPNGSSTGSNNSGSGNGSSSVTAKVSGTNSVIAEYSKSVSTSTDWITVAPAGSPLTTYQQWMYVPNSSGSVTFTGLTLGKQYEIRLFKNNGFTLLSSFNVEIRQLVSAWDCTVTNEGGQIWMRSFHGGSPQFAWRIGAGGTIPQLIDLVDNSKTLLGTPKRNVVTDHVTQWTLWNRSLEVSHDAYGVLNTTQAGQRDNILSATMQVHYSKKNGVCSVSVLSHVTDQWNTQLARHFDTSVPTLTTYDFAGGVLTISRNLLIRSIKKHGTPIAGTDYYLEAWSPFSGLEFNAVAMGLDTQGQPTAWYRHNYNLPLYPRIPMSSTRGWALLYRTDRMTSGVALAVIFGRAQSANGSNRILNFFSSDDAIVIQPAIENNYVPTGSMITQQIKIYMTRGISSQLGTMLDSVAAGVEPSNFISPSDNSSAELSNLRTLLHATPSLPGWRTELIGNIASN